MFASQGISLYQLYAGIGTRTASPTGHYWLLGGSSQPLGSEQLPVLKKFARVVFGR